MDEKSTKSTDTKERTCGEFLVECLEAYGIEVVFGIPGVHTIELYRGLQNTQLCHVTPRHEQAAGFMADGYARVTGKPAACFVITGPGMTNIATALAQAYADSVPMLVISSVSNTHELGMGQGRLHEMRNQQAMASELCVFSHTLLDPQNLPNVLARAFTVFESSRPGPVHIQLPLDVIIAPAGDVSINAVRSLLRPAPNPASITAAARLIRSAKNPFVILGGGTKDAPSEALALVECLGARTALTINAKGVLPPKHPLCIGSKLSEPAAQVALRDADVVLAIGTQLSETDTLQFNSQIEINGSVIRIDIDPEQLIRNVLPTVSVLGDAALAMVALIEELPVDPIFDHTQAVGALREKIEADQPQIFKVSGQLLELIEAILPGVIMVGDSTQPVYGGNIFYEPSQPRSFFNSSTGFGTLGYGLPAAFGAKLAAPERPVVSLIGDGGLQFTIGELSTAVELGLAIPIVVWNNQGYGEIKNYMVNSGIPCMGVDIYTPDFVTIAKGFGCEAIKVTSKEQFIAVLKDAATMAKVPTLIEIPEDAALLW